MGGYFSPHQRGEICSPHQRGWGCQNISLEEQRKTKQNLSYNLDSNIEVQFRLSRYNVISMILVIKIANNN